MKLTPEQKKRIARLVMKYGSELANRRSFPVLVSGYLEKIVGIVEEEEELLERAKKQFRAAREYQDKVGIVIEKPRRIELIESIVMSSDKAGLLLHTVVNRINRLIADRNERLGL